QKGRLREHNQLNVDILGVKSIDTDAEIIALSIEILKSLGGIKDYFSVKINNRKLTNYVLKEDVKLNEEQLFIASKAIDKKDKLKVGEFEKMLSDKDFSTEQIDKIVEYLETRTLANTRYDHVEGALEIMELFNKLEKYKVSEYCEFVPSIMRGFDYYTSTVFEVFDRSPENTRSMFGGGRYDDLLKIFGKDSFPAVGFGMGDVTLKEFLTIHSLLPDFNSNTKVMITIFEEELAEDSISIAQKLRSTGINSELYPTPSKLDKQLKSADKKGIPFVLIYGPEEKAKNKYQLKDLKKRESELLTFDELLVKLK
ncbi:ATP phosphoribosyltransferase regulatory subunit, partial [Candidatus Dojkabacteria bacterium]|nr:ATP phosphoribosyltransferase regulatory subunit [Candidatus Dojkabacteria bacterium]